MSYTPKTNTVGDNDILAQAISTILPMGGSDVYWDEIMMLIEDETKVVNVVKEDEESTSVKRMIDDDECTSASLDILKAVCDNLPPKESTSNKKVLLVEESTSVKRVIDDEECTLASLDMFGPEYIETLDEEDVKVVMIKISKFFK